MFEEDQMPLAIGNKGINIRLATRLTGYEIDVISIRGNSEDDSDGENNDMKEKVVDEQVPDTSNDEVKPTEGVEVKEGKAKE